MTKKQPQLPHYARVYELGQMVVLCCAYCGTKFRNGDALLKAWVSSEANILDIREQRNEHDRKYHQGWFNRHFAGSE